VAVVHRAYARALVGAAKDAGRLAEVREELIAFARSAREVRELGSLLENPELDRRVKLRALGDLLSDSDELVRNFVLLLVEKGRAGDLHEFVRELERLVAAEERRLELELTTAVELSDEEARGLVAQIERAAGRRVDARRKVDPSLIGGVVLQVGSFRVDASVRGRLQRLRRELRTATRART
jgi:F-type H+-transporting ATPase subunit delta